MGIQPLVPSGRVGFKLWPNYVAGFPAQRIVATLGYKHMPWVWKLALWDGLVDIRQGCVEWEGRSKPLMCDIVACE